MNFVKDIIDYITKLFTWWIVIMPWEQGIRVTWGKSRPLQVLVRVWTDCAMACPVARWHVKLRQAGATPWASGAIAYNEHWFM